MLTDLHYCPDYFAYSRRKTREITCGNVGIGGDNPIRVQSMITSDTRDTDACVKQVLDLAEAGCEIVRITAQTKKYAENLENIRDGVRAAGCDVPLVADIHFKPDAAFEAAKWVEKIRVNPGNYADTKKFAIREYTDEQYADELARIREDFAPLVELCKELGRAMRIGTNHGSLSDRIMNRYGDTPLGMVESALEFARIARDLGYHNFCFSMKASNPKVMIEAYRLLVARLDQEGPDWNYPIHLGVTEAGDGEDGRIKSAIGIGSLLADGVGDTIRVSLTEDAVYEIPVAQAIIANIENSHLPTDPTGSQRGTLSYDPFSYERRRSHEMEINGHKLGGANTIRVFTSREKWNALAHKMGKLGDFTPEAVLEDSDVIAVDPWDTAAIMEINAVQEPRLVTVADGSHDAAVIHAFRLLASKLSAHHPILLKDTLSSGCGFQPQCVTADSSSSPTITGNLEQDTKQDFITDTEEIKKSKATYLPHWQQDGAIYSLTFRLADSLPKSVTDHYLAEKARLSVLLEKEAKSIGDGEPTTTLKDLSKRISKLYSETIEDALNQGHGECHLRNEKVASSIVSSIRFFDDDRYKLIAWCLMPNHVHLIIQPISGHKLSDIMHSLKSYTAKSANDILGRSGTFWQKETYDHLIRDGEDYRNQLSYVLENPDKAQLSNWPWVGSVYGEAAAGSSSYAQPQDAAATFLDNLITAARNIGSLLCDGIGDAILVQGEPAPGQSLRLAYNVLQAAGSRIFKTDYVACPSCGRTLFNLQDTTQKIRAATGHLKGVRIAVMGCIVNGPGEMADADFGYVGGAPGKINLYVGKQAVKFNIPEAEAVDRLIDLIKDHDKWIDAPVA